jgi:beta-ureidopropionase
MESVEAVLQKYIPTEELSEVKRVLYGFNSGASVESVSVSEEVQKIAKEKGFEVELHRFRCGAEHTREPRIVKIGVIQNSIHDLDTSAPVPQQVTLVTSDAKT